MGEKGKRNCIDNISPLIGFWGLSAGGERGGILKIKNEKKAVKKGLQKIGEKGKRNFIDNISPLIGFRGLSAGGICDGEKTDR